MIRCQKRDCAEPATHAVKLCVPVVGQPDELPATDGCILNVVLCEAHIEDADPQAFLQSDAETLIPMIRVTMAPRHPDLARTYISGVSMHSPEYELLMRESLRGMN